MADRAVRISFVNRDGEISIRSATVVQKRAPASVSEDKANPGSGYWLELRDGERVVYRRLVSSQFENEVEVYGGGSDEPFRRVELSVPSEVDVVLPLPPAADARKLRMVLLERDGPDTRPRSKESSAKRGSTSKRKAPDRPHEKQHVEVGLGELVEKHQREK